MLSETRLLPIEQDGALGGGQPARKDREEGGLASPGRTKHCRHSATAQLTRNVAEAARAAQIRELDRHAFYQDNDAKSTLVVACFWRSAALAPQTLRELFGSSALH